jgi:flagellar hook-associated protein 2
MGLALSGLASGFDWKSIVDQLIEVSRAPQNRMRTEKSQLATKNSAINEIKGLVSSLKSSLTSLNSAEGFQKKSATFADSATTWTATADTDAPSGTYEFVFDEKATAAKLKGSTSIANKLDANSLLSSLPLGPTLKNGSFTIQGVQFWLTDENPTPSDGKNYIGTYQTLNEALSTINGGLSSEGTTIGYDSPEFDKITLLDNDEDIVLGASNDTSNFLQVFKLYNPTPPSDTVSSSSSLSSPRLSGPIQNANLITTGSSLIINGVSITADDSGNPFDVTQHSIQDVLNRINTSSAGVNATYDSSQGRFVLTNKNTGNVGISASGDLADALGLNTSMTPSDYGKDAQFTINGVTYTSRSNTIDESVHGITGLTVNAKFDETTPSKNTQTITVSSDTSTAKDAINTFIEKYNAVQNAIEKYTKVTVDGTKVSSAVLAGSRELAMISRQLRSILYNEVKDTSNNPVLTGSIQRLSDLGVGFSGIENTISIRNSALLDTALSSNSDDVIEYLTTDTHGLMDRLDSVLDRLVNDSSTTPGTFKVQTDSIKNQDKSLDKQIEEFERRLASQRALLESSFIAMERAQSGFQQQSSYLARTFSGNSK